MNDKEVSDYISREQALKAIERLCEKNPIDTWLANSLETVIEELPSAEKTGKWIITDAYPHKVYCSECYATLIPNVEWFKTYNIASNYCPNCGSRMER